MTRRGPRLPTASAALVPQLSLAAVDAVTAPPPPAASPQAPARAALDASQAVAVAEVLAIPVRLFPRMPAATTLALRTRGATLQPSRPCAITTSRAAYAAYRAARVATFTGDELVALATAAEHDRASPARFGEWLDRKLADPSWALSAREALGLAHGAFEPGGWALGRVLAAYDLDLVAVGVGAEVPGVAA